MKLLTIFISSIILSSCASQLHRGVVAMKIDAHTAHVGLNKSEVKVGDHVELYSNLCSKTAKNSTTTATTSTTGCVKTHKGHGVITNVISEDYAEVKFDDNVTFEEGNYIEKHSH